MTRFDTFPYAGEADMLELRLRTLAEVPDLVHVIVEADVDHQNNPKPFHYETQAERFAPWADRIRYVKATGLPDGADTFLREHGQRERTAQALAGENPMSVVFHGDVDEIPLPEVVRYTEPVGFIVCSMRFHPFAVDWLHPEPWPGTVAARLGKITSYAAMRDSRLTTPQMLLDAGWHFSWVGDEKARHRKINSFCHPEIKERWTPHLEDCWASGLHVDGTPLKAVDVNDEWPAWITERRCPESWFRPANPKPRPDVEPVPIFARFAS